MTKKIDYSDQGKIESNNSDFGAGIKKNQKIRMEIQKTKEIKTVDKLTGRCAYFPIADYHNLKIFKNHNKILTELDISNRLYLALLLFDRVVMHCSDPLRSIEVFNVLQNNKQFIKSGNILFVFSRRINNIERDYKKYIQDKIIEYGKNPSSVIDVESLTQQHINDEYYKKVIKLLNCSYFLVKKEKEGISGFKDLIKTDLEESENIIMEGDDFSRSYIRIHNLSLFQLLNFKYYKNNILKSLFNQEKIKEFISNWIEDAENGVPFSRHIIIKKLKDSIIEDDKDAIKLSRQIIDVIETRLALLYSKLNFNGHQIILFHPATEKRSIYSWKYFELFFTKIADNNNIQLNQEIVKLIRESSEWELFRSEYLSCMATMNDYLHLSKKNESKKYEYTEEMFYKILDQYQIGTKFLEIKQILITKGGN